MGLFVGRGGRGIIIEYIIVGDIIIFTCISVLRDGIFKTFVLIVFGISRNICSLVDYGFGSKFPK